MAEREPLPRGVNPALEAARELVERSMGLTGDRPEPEAVVREPVDLVARTIALIDEQHSPRLAQERYYEKHVAQQQPAAPVKGRKERAVDQLAAMTEAQRDRFRELLDEADVKAMGILVPREDADDDDYETGDYADWNYTEEEEEAL